MGEQPDSNLEATAVQVIEPNPLPITYRVIYDCLKDIFPDHATLILNAIHRIVVIEKEDATFSTMGVTKDGTLFIARTFWDEHMKEDNSLKTVLMHEMMHCIGGDMFHLRTPEEDPDDWKLHNTAHNIAMDSRINAYICNMRPDISPEDFFSSFYDEEANQKNMLSKLLTPSGVFNYDGGDEESLAKYHTKFYNTEDFCSHHDLYEEVLEILKKQPKGKTLKIKLLGAHGAGGEELTDKDLEGVDHIEIDTSELDKIKQEDAGRFREEAGQQGPDTAPGQGDLPDAIKDAIMDQVGASSAGAGKGAKSAAHLLKLASDVTEKFDLSKFKKMMFDNIFHNVRTQARVRVGTYTSSPIMPKSISTSDLIMAACGHTPVMWKTHKHTHKFDNNLLPIYLDVSGSTYSHLPRIVKLITNVSSELEFVWGFSNRIEKHTTKELSEGIIKGTGGTDFDCIIEHATAHKYEHIVVISDGHAYCKQDGGGYNSTGPAPKVPGIKSVVTVLFGYTHEDNYFSRAYNNTHMIEEVIV
tara:strand:- start:186782 stop:188362 length:1581 start_codon:yes stop_codon:yes gene_type:complete